MEWCGREVAMNASLKATFRFWEKGCVKITKDYGSGELVDFGEF